MLTDDRGLIALSGRHLVDDQLWFTFFHEAAHLILHGGMQPYIEDLELTFQTADTAEVEANNLAEGTLVPGELLAILSTVDTVATTIVRLAREWQVAPGILVGQLQHMKRIGFSSGLNQLKRRYRWNGAILGMV